MRFALVVLFLDVVGTRRNGKAGGRSNVFEGTGAKSGEVSSSDAKWIRKTFAPAFGAGEVGDNRQQELIATVRSLEEQRARFSTAILGYLKGPIGWCPIKT